MYFSRFALASALALPLVYGATGSFSYDPEHEYGPDNWYNLAIDGNVCDGRKNSPIAVETHGCDRFEDYRFVVSCYISFPPLGFWSQFVSFIIFSFLPFLDDRSYLCSMDLAPPIT
jgi:hypothetical protein